MRAFVVCLLPVLGLLAACSGQQALVDAQARQIDSLYVIERGILAELYALQDSIQFYDDIDSGRYYRDRRLLTDRINRLEFLLAARTDTLADALCAPEPVDTLLADALFEPASATLHEDGAARLEELAERLKTDYANRRFRIEGHSDNVPLSPKLREQYESNWELAAARALRVTRTLVDAHGLPPSRLEAVSFGDTQPAASNLSAEGRRQNRRIVIYALPQIR